MMGGYPEIMLYYKYQIILSKMKMFTFYCNFREVYAEMSSILLEIDDRNVEAQLGCYGRGKEI